MVMMMMDALTANTVTSLAAIIARPITTSTATKANIRRETTTMARMATTATFAVCELTGRRNLVKTHARFIEIGKASCTQRASYMQSLLLFASDNNEFQSDELKGLVNTHQHLLLCPREALSISEPRDNLGKHARSNPLIIHALPFLILRDYDGFDVTLRSRYVTSTLAKHASNDGVRSTADFRRATWT